MSSIGFKQKSNYYKNYDKFSEDKVVKIILENNTDSVIWKDAFPNVKGIRYIFSNLIIESKNLNLSPSEGCKQLEKVYGLGKHLIICKDSDFSYIKNIILESLDMSDKKAIENPHIYETRVHSIENIIYYIDYIKSHFANHLFTHESSFESIWLDKFYLEFSNLIYEPLVKLLILNIYDPKEDMGLIYKALDKINLIKLSSLNDFNVFFEMQEWNATKQSISNLNKSFDQKLKTRNLINKFEKVKTDLNQNHITNKNIYLFFRGHDINSLFQRLLKDYLKFRFNACVDEICSQLDGNAAKEKRRSLKKSSPNLNLRHDIRDLDKISFFQDTVSQIAKDYK